MIDRATVDRIIDAARIVDVVGEFVTLRKSGVNYKGLCPFHDDKNPSFMVSPAKNICHCFVCGKGGTPAGFLMEHEQMTYPDALRWLARKYNIEIVEKELTDEERREQGERESMFVVNEWAKDYFHRTLLNDPDGLAIGRQYFRSRGIRDDIIEKFQLGFALSRRDAMSREALKAGYKAEFLVKTGLCYRREGSNELVDRYSGRAIFPWLNISGKVVAFGGRKLDAATKGVQQKYVNSPESDIYHKERELYGIYQAKKAIVKEDCVFMVEGYTDVIAMHQAGIENVVANSGTALSMHQIHMLHRFTSNITLLYDGDEAGIHAAMRGTDMLLAEGMKVRVLLLPDGDDPDSFARKHSSQELKDYIEKHQTDFITFKSRLTVENVTDPVKRSEAIGSIVKSISVVPDQILRSAYLTDFALRVGMKEETLIAEMNKYIRQNIEEKQKERERENRRNTDTTTPTRQQSSSLPPDLPPEEWDEAAAATTTVPTATTDSLPALHTPQEQASQVELLLVREIVRHGEEVIFDNVETDDGQQVSLNVAQYIDLDLSQDNLHFASPLHNQILAEAVARSQDEGFKAETYFTSHPDLAVSQLATRLAIDRHQLGGRFVVQPREGSLRQHVLHLMMDYRRDIVEQRLKAILRQMRTPGITAEETMKLLQEHKETKELRDALARRLGSDLVV
ncbi:MAG: DNA primase [Prevotella sp.]|nr:DNA primase [Prevotella sp.]